MPLVAWVEHIVSDSVDESIGVRPHRGIDNGGNGDGSWEENSITFAQRQMLASLSEQIGSTQVEGTTTM